MFLAASPAQLEQGRIAIEHTVMSRVYHHALYPNGDVDTSRDQYVYYNQLVFNVLMVYFLGFCQIIFVNYRKY